MIFRRLIAWISEEVIVKNLSRNRTFQRFAVRMDDKLTKNKQVLEKMRPEDITGAVAETAKSVDVRKSFAGVVDFMKKVHSNVK